MKYIIAGRSGSGKTELANRLESKGLKILKTYTTRPMRGESEKDKYHFIDAAELENYSNRILDAEFSGNRYFALPEDVQNSDVLILEPTGVFEILEKFPDTQFCLVYISADRQEIADARAIARAKDQDAEREIVKKRREMEDERFGPLESMLQNKTYDGTNCVQIHVANDFQPETLDKLAANMTGKFRKHTNFMKILNQLVALGAFITDENNKTPITIGDKDYQISLDIFAEMFCDDDATFSYLMRSWLTHDINIQVPGELAPEFMFQQKINE